MTTSPALLLTKPHYPPNCFVFAKAVRVKTLAEKDDEVEKYEAQVSAKGAAEDRKEHERAKRAAADKHHHHRHHQHYQPQNQHLPHSKHVEIDDAALGHHEAQKAERMRQRQAHRRNSVEATDLKRQIARPSQRFGKKHHEEPPPIEKKDSELLEIEAARKAQHAAAKHHHPHKHHK